MKYFLMVYMFVPTTLFSTMPLIQIFSSLFMLSDIDMYDEEQDETCQVNAPTLLEEIGQVWRAQLPLSISAGPPLDFRSISRRPPPSFPVDLPPSSPLDLPPPLRSLSGDTHLLR